MGLFYGFTARDGECKVLVYKSCSKVVICVGSVPKWMRGHPHVVSTCYLLLIINTHDKHE